MDFELKLDMHNAELEAVWLNDFIREHDVDEIETSVKERKPEVGEMSGDILLPVLTGIASGVPTEGIKWLIGKVYQHFQGKKGSMEFSATCPENGKSLTIQLPFDDEKQRDQAQAEFERRYEELCGKDKKKKKSKKKKGKK